MFWQLWCTIRQRRPALVVMEGSGVAGGLALLLGRWFSGVPYVVSSGDAIGPWVGSHRRWLGPVFGLYERLLCRFADGFIGWTPYLVGRAMSFGCSRAMTAAGWAPFHRTAQEQAEARQRVRAKWGIAPNAVVVGIAGAMIWTERFQSCYGAELVRAILRSSRPNVVVLLVGDGTGRPKLEAMAGDRCGTSIIFTGRVPQSDVPDYLAAMDVGSLPQSVDQTGGFRYTTKISEYLDARLPMITGQVPMGYDLDDGWIWRLPGDAPWDERYVKSLVAFLDRITPDDIAQKQAAIPRHHPTFDRERQVGTVTAFIHDLLERRNGTHVG